MCMSCVKEGQITKKLLDACEEFIEKWPESPYGPAHIVIDDNNAEDENIQWCLDHWEETEASIREACDESADDPTLDRSLEVAATKAFLKELLTWPLEERLGPAGLAREAEKLAEGK
jgi:hypothetical protein